MSEIQTITQVAGVMYIFRNVTCTLMFANCNFVSNTLEKALKQLPEETKQKHFARLKKLMIDQKIAH